VNKRDNDVIDYHKIENMKHSVSENETQNLPFRSGSDAKINKIRKIATATGGKYKIKIHSKY